MRHVNLSTTVVTRQLKIQIILSFIWLNVHKTEILLTFKVQLLTIHTCKAAFFGTVLEDLFYFIFFKLTKFDFSYRHTPTCSVYR